MPLPTLVSPPSVALSPLIVEWTSGWEIVTLKPLVSILAPPSRTWAVVSAVTKLSLSARACSVPPLKSKVLWPCPPTTPNTLSVPPLRR